MSALELRPGVWSWHAEHPGWNEDQWWPQVVASHAIAVGDDELLLIDPLAVPDELRSRATAVVLTAPWHERDARQLGPPVHTPPVDTWQDWVEKFGAVPEQVRGRQSDDLVWARTGEAVFHDAGAWPFGITAFAGREHNDLQLWFPEHATLATGDTVSNFSSGLGIQLGTYRNVTRDELASRLRSQLLELPIELVLPAHGEPTDLAGLERALA